MMIAFLQVLFYPHALINLKADESHNNLTISLLILNLF